MEELIDQVYIICSKGWQTPEHILVPPVYDSAAYDGLDFLNTYPGIPPFLRGPYATMYVNQPWTIRQYAGFSAAQESNAFYRHSLAAGQKGDRSRSIWPPTARLRLRPSAGDR